MAALNTEDVTTSKPLPAVWLFSARPRVCNTWPWKIIKLLTAQPSEPAQEVQISLDEALLIYLFI